jgi:type I restriction enzyme S subunit
MWKTTNIGTVCLQTSQRDPQQEPDKEFTYIDIASVDNQTKRINGSQRMLGKDAPSRARKEIRWGDVLVSTVRPNLNAVALVPPTFDGQIASTGFCVLRPNPELVDSRYLFYRTTTPTFINQLSLRVRGANYPAVSDSAVKSTAIPLPPLPIQKQIAAILEKADAAREKRRQANQLTEQFLQSAFLEMFGDPVTNPKGWKKRTLGEMADKFSDGPFGSNLKSEHYTSSGVRIIRLQNIGIGDLIDEDKAYISEDHFSSIAKHTCLPGDILIGTLGDPNLRACILPPSIPIALNKADCIQMRPKKNVAIAQYVNALLNQPATMSLVAGMIHGQTRARINMGRLRELTVPCPPLSDQQKFATVVEMVDSLRTKQRESEKDLEDLFHSLMQRAFKGELVG